MERHPAGYRHVPSGYWPYTRKRHVYVGGVDLLSLEFPEVIDYAFSRLGEDLHVGSRDGAGRCLAEPAGDVEGYIAYVKPVFDSAILLSRLVAGLAVLVGRLVPEIVELVDDHQVVVAPVHVREVDIAGQCRRRATDRCGSGRRNGTGRRPGRCAGRWPCRASSCRAAASGRARERGHCAARNT